MDIKKPSYLAVEIDLTSLNALREQRAGADLDDRSSQSQTIGLDEASNVDAISDLKLIHGSLSKKNRLWGQTTIIPVCTARAKEFPITAPQTPENSRYTC